MIKTYLTFFFVLAAYSLLYGQNSECGYKWLLSQHNAVVRPQADVARCLLDSLGQTKHLNMLQRTEIVIPVVVHIVWKNHDENISDERVFSQLEVLNRDFNGENEDAFSVPKEFEMYRSKRGIRFCLAAVDPQGKQTSGILRIKSDINNIGIKNELYFTSVGGSDAWDTKRYMNIWVANTGDFLTGFGTYPGQVPSYRDGLVIHPKYFGANNSQRYSLGRVAVHEVGHYFGLLHTWGDDESCATDDGVSDTPPQLSPYRGCPAHPQISCSKSDMFMNFMDYVDDECMVMFTKGQMDRVLNTIEIFRHGLLATNISCIDNKNENSDIKFILYPNPSYGSVNITFKDQLSEIGQVEVLNAIGQRIFLLNTVLFNHMYIDLPITDPGIYWVRIGNRTEKLIVM